MSTKTKELTKTEVSDNGEAKEPTLQEELESIVNQYNDAIQKRNQFDELAKRCLGAIEVYFGTRLLGHGLYVGQMPGVAVADAGGDGVCS